MKCFLLLMMMVVTLEAARCPPKGAKKDLSVLFLANDFTMMNKMTKRLEKIGSMLGYKLKLFSLRDIGYKIKVPHFWLYDYNKAIVPRLLKENSEKFDVVVLQEHPAIPAFSYDKRETGAKKNYVQKDTLPAAQNITAALRKVNPCTRFIFLETPPPFNSQTWNNLLYRLGFGVASSFKKMLHRTRLTYQTLAYQNKGEVSPVGEVFGELRQKLKFNNFRRWYDQNEYNPSARGTVVVAMTLAETITGKSVNTWRLRRRFRKLPWLVHRVITKGKWDYTNYTGQAPCPKCTEP